MGEQSTTLVLALCPTILIAWSHGRFRPQETQDVAGRKQQFHGMTVALVELGLWSMFVHSGSRKDASLYPPMRNAKLQGRLEAFLFNNLNTAP